MLLGEGGIELLLPVEFSFLITQKKKQQAQQKPFHHLIKRYILIIINLC